MPIWLLLAAAGGGYWWWKKKHGTSKSTMAQTLFGEEQNATHYTVARDTKGFVSDPSLPEYSSDPNNQIPGWIAEGTEVFGTLAPTPLSHDNAYAHVASADPAFNAYGPLWMSIADLTVK